MPVTDPARKAIITARWKERTARLGYNKWLYERRKLRFDAAVLYHQTLTEILSCPSLEAAQIQAARALKEIENREAKLGSGKAFLRLAEQKAKK